MAKCIIILSNKSSGSSACQNLLSKFANIKHVIKTRHFENETLYWTKAASILGLPQKDMLDSEVPISTEKAKHDLVTLLRDNLDYYLPPENEREMIFNGWRLLCEKYSPVFVEKSPHHLYQWSALELIIECIEKLTEVDFLLIGLVRNPMDTLYSVFTRWRTQPEENQNEWFTAYQNLFKLKEIMGEKLVIIRYEDMVSSLCCLKPVFDFCDVNIEDADQGYLNNRSIAKWKKDYLYSFNLSEKVLSLAEEYGYERQELFNKRHFLWTVYSNISRSLYKILKLG